ncbi:MAG: LemA family protein [Pseudomonadota bacterium]
MNGAGLVFLAILSLIFVYAIFTYNRLVGLKHGVAKAWSNIDVLLKQRHDELPKLVEACRQYMKFEQDTLEKVMQARSRVSQARESHDIKALGEAEGALRMGLEHLFAVAEAYPELKANETFAHLQARITGLEEAIADRREFYNDSVNLNNVAIERFPDVIIAQLTGFGPHRLLKFTSRETADVSITSMFKR